MKLSDIRIHTSPAEIALDETNKITLQVFTRKSTVAKQREIASLIDVRMTELETARKSAGKLDRERETIMQPILAFDDKLAALQESLSEAAPVTRAKLREEISKIEAKRDETSSALEPKLEKLNERAVELIEAGQASLQFALAEKLAFYVSSHDIVGDDGSALPSTAEFFNENFDHSLLELAAAAVDSVLAGPLVTRETGNS